MQTKIRATLMRFLPLLTVLFIQLSVQAQNYNFLKSPGSTSPTPSGDCYTLTNSDATGWKLVGGIPVNITSYWGAVWYDDLLDLSKKFDIEFDVNLGNRSIVSQGGDGLAFVMQTVGNNVNGFGGDGMGYTGFSPSLVVEFDTYDNNSWSTGSDISPDHVAVLKNGSNDHLSANSIASPVSANTSGELEDGLDHHVRISWDPASKIFQVYVECSLKINITYDIPAQVFSGTTSVFWGFTAGTGGSRNVQKVCVQKTVLDVPDTVSICGGSPVSISALGAGIGSTYLWTPNYNISATNVQSPTVSPLVDTTYHVAIADVCGFTRYDSVKVLTSPAPTVNLGADTTICAGVTKVLNAGNAGSTYAWSSGATTQTINAPLTAGTYTYTVTVTNPSSCSASDRIVVTVRAIPTANAGADKTICSGATVGLTGSGGGIYAWPSGATTAITSVNPTTTTSYYVTVTNAAGCTDDDYTVVTVNPAITANAGSDQQLCTGAGTSLTASGGTNYVWSSGATAAIANISPASTTTYTVTVSTGSCSGTDNVVVSVESVTANAGTDTTICNGVSITRTASGGSTYAWSSGATTAALSETPLATTTYTVTASGSWCTAIDSVVITVNNVPVIAATKDSSICRGKSLMLLASGAGVGGSYVWSNTASGSSVAVSPVNTTTYSVTGTNTNGCSDSEEVIVTIIALPTADAGTDVLICTGGSTGLTGAGGTAFAWSTSDVTSVISVAPVATATYTLTVTQSGCSDSDQVVVSVDETIADPGNDTTVCPGSPVTLTASGGVSYSWSSGPNTATFNVSPLVATTYTVTVTNGSCTASDFVIVSMHTLPTANAGTDATVCPGGSPVLSASGGTTYLWSTTEPTADITVTPLVETTYTVTVTDVNGCSDTDDVTVFIQNSLVVDAGKDSTICSGTTVQLQASGAAVYTWSNGASTAQQDVTPLVTTTYAVTGTDGGTCTNTDEIVITVITTPTANAGIDDSICVGESANLSASGTGTVLWSTGAITAAEVVSPIVTSTYSVTISNATCTSSDEVVVFVSSFSLSGSANDTTICSGASVMLSATGATSYLWSTTETTQNITVTPLVPTTYVVTMTDANSCSQSEDIVVNVNAIPTANAGADVLICLGDSTVLKAIGGGSYKWSTSEVTDSIIVKPFITTTYLLTVTAGGCTDGDAVEVSVSETIADPGNDTTVCPGSPVTLTATGGTSYSWSTTETTASILVAPMVSSTYSVTVTNGLCTASDEVIVSMHDVPAAQAGTDATICPGASPKLSASGGVGFLWNTAETTFEITVTPAVESTYTVTVTDANGCTDSDDVTVFIQNSLVVDAGKDSTICSGNTIQLVATGAAFYTWSDGALTSINAVSPIASTTYTVTGSDGGTCTGTDEVILTILSSPTANAGADDSICAGQSATLVATGGGNYAWSSGSVIDTETVSPVTTSTYTVSVSNGTCIDTDEVIIFVPSFVLSGGSNDTTVCAGNALTLTASGGVGYLWSTTEITPNIVVSPATTTTYSVTITDLNACTGTQDVVVTVSNNPAFTLVSNDPVCVGSTLSITASPLTNIYTWSTGAVNAILYDFPTAATTYTVTAANLQGCTASNTIAIAVNSLPVATASGPDSVCNGAGAVLTAGGGTSYYWSEGGNIDMVIVNPVTTTTYSVTVYDNNLCFNVASVVVNIKGSIPVNAGASTAICAGDSVQLNASGSNTYLWNTGDVLSNPYVKPAVSVTYTVTGTTQGCSTSDEVTVDVHSIPVADAGKDTSVCSGQSVMLSGAGSTAFAWSDGASAATTSVSPTTQTTYTVTVADGIGCSDTDDIVVLVNTSPTVAVNGSTSACAGEAATVFASGGNAYTWSNGDNTATITPLITANVTYTVTVTSSAGCTATATHAVLVNALPFAPTVVDIKSCKGMQINGDFKIASPSPTETYNWYDKATGGILLNTGTLYTIYNGNQLAVYAEAVSVHGCVSLGRGQGMVVPGIEPVAGFSVDPSTTVIDKDIQFTDTSHNVSKWLWSFGDYATSTDKDPVYSYNKAGSYDIRLIVNSADGCKDTADLKAYKVSVPDNVYIPDAFSPNNDNANDVFRILGSPLADVSFQVYDQWGIQVFTSNSKDNGWDGTFKGTKQPSGNYTYLLKASTLDGALIEKQGVVSLIR